MAVYKPSFADAELAEYGAEDFIVGDLAGNSADMVDGFSQILGYELCEGLCVQCFANSVKALFAAVQGFKVTKIRNQCLVFIETEFVAAFGDGVDESGDFTLGSTYRYNRLRCDTTL